MRKVDGDPAALVAATLVQAEMALRGGLLAGRKQGTLVQGSPRKAVADSYEYFLQLVETGQRPAPADAEAD